MLFDLRGRGRRNTVKVVYIALAFLMGGGLVLFGIGGNTNGGLVDAITGSGGSTDAGADRFKSDIKKAQATLKTNPKDEEAWVTLIRAQVGIATTGDNYDSEKNTYSKAGEASLREATVSWTKYQAINPKNKEEEARVAARVVQAYASLNDLPNLVSAQEVVALNRNAVGPYAALAQYAYAAGQTRKGDLAAKKALELEDPDQRAQLKGDLDQYKQDGAAVAAQQAAGEATAAPSAEATPAATKTPAAKKKSGTKTKKSSK